MLRRREKRGESGLQVSPYLLSMSHTGRCNLDRSTLSALFEFLRSRQRKKFSSRTRLSVPELHYWCRGQGGGTLEVGLTTTTGRRTNCMSLFRRAKWPYPWHWMHVTLNVRHIKCTSRWMYVTFNARHIRCTWHYMYVTLNVRHTKYTWYSIP